MRHGTRAVRVAPVRTMSAAMSAGLCESAITRRAPSASVASVETNVTWNSGSSHSRISSCEKRMPAISIATRLVSAPCESSTPRGSPVVPLVYSSMAGSPSSTSHTLGTGPAEASSSS